MEYGICVLLLQYCRLVVSGADDSIECTVLAIVFFLCYVYLWLGVSCTLLVSCTR